MSADCVIIADIYEAGETPIEGIDKNALIEGICAHGHRNVMALDAPENLASLVADYARPNDYVICLGAGDITGWAYDLPEQLEALLHTKESAA